MNENNLYTERYMLVVYHYRRGKVDYKSELCFIDMNESLRDATQRAIEYCNDNEISGVAINMNADSFIKIGLKEIPFARQFKSYAQKTYYEFVLTIVKNDMRQINHTSPPHHLIEFPF